MKRALSPKSKILVPWIGGLTALIFVVALVANFGIGKQSMEDEVADHWKPAIAAAGATAPQAPNPQAAAAEQAYNAAARDVDRVAVSITAESASPQPSAPTRSFGSGFFVGRGVVLTNYHVVQQSSAVWVTAYSPTKADYPAVLVAHDQEADLAVLRVPGIAQNDVARAGASDRVGLGDIVFAAGNVLGVGNTVTSGMVSNRRNDLVIDGRSYPEMIQVDATVNHGSSGGPLVNLAGEVIGINTAIYAPGGTATGIGFATPINRARPLLAKAQRLLAAGGDQAPDLRAWTGPSPGPGLAATQLAATPAFAQGLANPGIAAAWGNPLAGAPVYAPSLLQQAPLVCPFCHTARHPRCPTCQQRLVFDPTTATLVCPSGHQVAVNCACPRCGGRMAAAPPGRGPISLAV